MIEFGLRTEIAAPPEVVFAASLSVDAHLASMRSAGERAVAGVRSGRMALGDTVTWKARHFGVVWTMTSRITELAEPGWFVDEQQRGPFRSFRHEHGFQPTAGGTLMTDRIRFTAPVPVVGWVAERVVLGWYLRRLIRQRNSFLAQLSAG